jgi:hypothetical protein
MQQRFLNFQFRQRKLKNQMDRSKRQWTIAVSGGQIQLTAADEGQMLELPQYHEVIRN